mmetsp:Transcript_28022/g.82034  ORF Transcript_28022/g.82034 Transcript_28022/m.82034 type:complete len:433 (-) Transcript_28022:190-1488(-)
MRTAPGVCASRVEQLAGAEREQCILQLHAFEQWSARAAWGRLRRGLPRGPRQESVAASIPPPTAPRLLYLLVSPAPILPPLLWTRSRTLDFLDIHLSRRQPVFAVLAVPAAHEPADPAPQYADYGQGLVAPRTPNFNKVMADDDRHWMVANVNVNGSAMNDTVISFVDLLYRRRLATLQSVDDVIESVVATLSHYGALENSYVIYSADNGYHLGQFALGLDKRQPYDTDLRLPFFARGPGIPRNTTIAHGALVTIDLTPTFLELAGMSRPAIAALGMDGEPSAALLKGRVSKEQVARDFLVEYNGEKWDACAAYLANDFPDLSFDLLSDGLNCGLRGPSSFATAPFWEGTETFSSVQDSANNTYTCVRSINATHDLQYCEWKSGEIEFFNVAADSWQMTNLVSAMPAGLQAAFRAKLRHLTQCQGQASCSSF